MGCVVSDPDVAARAVLATAVSEATAMSDELEKVDVDVEKAFEEIDRKLMLRRQREHAILSARSFTPPQRHSRLGSWWRKRRRKWPA
jgi:hypothetical protein